MSSEINNLTYNKKIKSNCTLQSYKQFKPPSIAYITLYNSEFQHEKYVPSCWYYQCLIPISKSENSHTNIKNSLISLLVMLVMLVMGPWLLVTDA